MTLGLGDITIKTRGLNGGEILDHSLLRCPEWSQEGIGIMINFC